jgi:DNA repair exonuclease SbcCD ATPase subunit
MKTFDILSEYYSLMELIEEAENNPEYNPETGEIIPVEEILKEEIEKLEGEKIEKLENIEYLKRDNKSKIDTLADEIKRLQGRKKSFENANDNLTKLQDYLLQGEKLKTDKFTFSYRKSKAVEIINEDLIPDEYKKIEYKVDKMKLKKALENTKIQEAELVEKKSLSVR